MLAPQKSTEHLKYNDQTTANQSNKSEIQVSDDESNESIDLLNPNFDAEGTNRELPTHSKSDTSKIQTSDEDSNESIDFLDPKFNTANTSGINKSGSTSNKDQDAHMDEQSELDDETQCLLVPEQTTVVPINLVDDDVIPPTQPLSHLPTNSVKDNFSVPTLVLRPTEKLEYEFCAATPLLEQTHTSKVVLNISNVDNDDFCAPTQILDMPLTKNFDSVAQNSLKSSNTDEFLAPTQLLEDIPCNSKLLLIQETDDVFGAPTQRLDAKIESPKSIIKVFTTPQDKEFRIKSVHSINKNFEGDDTDFLAPTQELIKNSIKKTKLVFLTEDDADFLAPTQELLDNSCKIHQNLKSNISKNDADFDAPTQKLDHKENLISKKLFNDTFEAPTQILNQKSETFNVLPDSEGSDSIVDYCEEIDSIPEICADLNDIQNVKYEESLSETSGAHNDTPKDENAQKSSKSNQLDLEKDSEIFLLSTQKLIDLKIGQNQNSLRTFPEKNLDSEELESTNVISKIIHGSNEKIFTEQDSKEQREISNDDNSNDSDIIRKKKPVTLIHETQECDSNDSDIILRKKQVTRIKYTQDTQEYGFKKLSTISESTEMQNQDNLSLKSSFNENVETQNTSLEESMKLYISESENEKSQTETQLEIDMPTEREFFESQNSRPQNPLVSTFSNDTESQSQKIAGVLKNEDQRISKETQINSDNEESTQINTESHLNTDYHNMETQPITDEMEQSSSQSSATYDEVYCNASTQLAGTPPDQLNASSTVKRSGRTRVKRTFSDYVTEPKRSKHTKAQTAETSSSTKIEQQPKRSKRTIDKENVTRNETNEEGQTPATVSEMKPVSRSSKRTKDKESTAQIASKGLQVTPQTPEETNPRRSKRSSKEKEAEKKDSRIRISSEGPQKTPETSSETEPKRSKRVSKENEAQKKDSRTRTSSEEPQETPQTSNEIEPKRSKRTKGKEIAALKKEKTNKAAQISLEGPKETEQTLNETEPKRSKRTKNKDAPQKIIKTKEAETSSDNAQNFIRTLRKKRTNSESESDQTKRLRSTEKYENSNLGSDPAKNTKMEEKSATPEKKQADENKDLQTVVRILIKGLPASTSTSDNRSRRSSTVSSTSELKPKRGQPKNPEQQKQTKVSDIKSNTDKTKIPRRKITEDSSNGLPVNEENKKAEPKTRKRPNTKMAKDKTQTNESPAKKRYDQLEVMTTPSRSTVSTFSQIMHRDNATIMHNSVAASSLYMIMTG